MEHTGVSVNDIGIPLPAVKAVPAVETGRLTTETRQLTKEEWDAVVCGFDDASIYQSWSWGEVRRGEKRLCHTVLKQDGVPVGAAQVWVVGIPLIGHGIAYVKWGPMWRRAGNGARPEIFRAMIRALQEEYARKRGLLLRITPNVMDANADEVYELMREEGFEPARYTSPYRTLVIDLCRTDDEIRSAMKPQWRQRLHKAERQGLAVKELSGETAFDEVESLYDDMHRRKGFAEFLDVRLMRDVQHGLPAGGKMMVLACMSGGAPVAVGITSRFNSGAIELIAASRLDGLKLCATHLLQWHTISTLKGSGCGWYDLGGIDPVKYGGPYAFKAGLAGKGGRDVTFSDFEYCNSYISGKVVRLYDRVRSSYRSSKEAYAELRQRKAA